MKKLLTITDQTFNTNASEMDTANFRQRKAARCVVFDSEGKVGLIYSKRYNYYKIAGGGIEEGEDIAEALKREIKEELGVGVKVDGEVGEIFESRGLYKKLQTSYCYYGHIVGEKGEPHFDEEETKEQFETVWVADIDEAIKLTKSDGNMERGNNYEYCFMTMRDTTFLNETKRILKL